MHCGHAADLTWTANPFTATVLTPTWPVCFEHYRRLGAGERWAARRGKFLTCRRWILMGADLDT